MTKSHFEGKVRKGLFQLTLPQLALREVRSGGQGGDLEQKPWRRVLTGFSLARVQLAFLNSPDLRDDTALSGLNFNQQPSRQFLIDIATGPAYLGSPTVETPPNETGE